MHRLTARLEAETDALAAGAITAEHVKVLARASRRVGADVLAEAEPALLDLAKQPPRPR